MPAFRFLFFVSRVKNKRIWEVSLSLSETRGESAFRRQKPIL